MVKMLESQITGKFTPAMVMPKVIPHYIQGEDAQAIYEAIKDFGNFYYDSESKTMFGSNLPAAARIDTLVRPSGLRVATLRDLSRPEVMHIIKEKHCIDAPVLVARRAKDHYKPNQILLKELLPYIEQREGKVKFPFMATGFDVAKNTVENGYGWTIVPRDDFAVTYDERLAGKHHAKSFDEVDEQGLPNFDKNGSRIWYTSNQGLSRLCLDWDFSLDSGYGDLADSDGCGRIVLVRDLK